MQTRTYQFVASRLNILFPSPEQQALQEKAADIHQATPTYITGEDDISIEVLTNPQSAEWQWLTGMYDQIHQAVSEDDIPLVPVIFPLAYQLDEHYPYFPQKLLSAYCVERNLYCLDMLDIFRKQGKEKIFILDKERGYDVWHLTAEGHTVSANALFEFLKQHHLLKNGKTDETQ
jgi:hypothetical protein